MTLHDERHAGLGSDFSLEGFHSRFLSNNCAPVRKIYGLMAERQ